MPTGLQGPRNGVRVPGEADMLAGDCDVTGYFFISILVTC